MRKFLWVCGMASAMAVLCCAGAPQEPPEARRPPAQEVREVMAAPRYEPREPRVLNLLLIGKDTKPEEPGSRSDSMILCTVCPDKKSLTFTSILRDLYVDIPGYGKNRINAAYAFGGEKLLRRTLRESLGVVTQGYVEVDFSQFAQLMDLLGGVPMEIRKDEAGEINRKVPGSSLHPGTCILTGEQALAYARIRCLDPDADVSRTGRQRRVLEQVFQQYQQASPRTLVALLQQLLPMVTTDLTNRDILYWAGLLLPAMKELQVNSFRIPAPGTYGDLTVNGMAVLQADLSANRRLLGEIQAGGC